MENSSIKILDQAILDQLLQLGSKEDLRKIYQSFVQDTVQNLNNCRVKLQKKDWITVERMIHTIKGNSGTLGADRLYSYAIHAEKLAKQKEEQKLIAILEEFDKEINIFQDYLKKQIVFPI